MEEKKEEAKPKYEFALSEEIEEREKQSKKENTLTMEIMPKIFSEDDIDENGVYRVPNIFDSISYGLWELDNPKIKKIVLGSRVKYVCGESFHQLPENCKEIDLSQTEIYSIPNAEAPRYCPKLEKIVFPKTLKKIGESAFKNFTSLKSVEFDPETNLEVIGGEAFLHTNIRRLVIPKSNERLIIEARAFGSCETLKEVDIPSNTAILSMAFIRCTSLNHITLHEDKDKPIHVYPGAFYECYSLKSVRIPDGVDYVSSNMFANCSSLSEVVLPESIEVIGESAFLNNYKLTTINLPKNLIRIDDNAFDHCDLEKLDLPDGLTHIGTLAFRGNQKLKEIVLPDSVKYVGNDCFSFCSSLEKIVYPEEMTDLNRVGVELQNLREVVLPKNLKVIQSACFRKTPLEKIEIPKTLNLIGNNAFALTNIKEFIMPEGELTDIGYDAFLGCQKLEKVVLPNGLHVIGAGAFGGCENLKEIVLPDNIYQINSNAFSNCSSLEEIKIGSGKTYVGTALFEGCENLKSITIEEAIFSSSTFDKLPQGVREIKVGKNCIFDDYKPIEGLEYLTYKDGYFYFTREPMNEESVNLQKFCNGKEVLMTAVFAFWDERNMFKKLLEEDNMIADLINMLYEEKGAEGLKEFFVKNKNNLKFFKQIKIDASRDDRKKFCKFYYNLGGFENNYQELKKDKNGNRSIVSINYAQKVGEFIKEMIKTYPIFFKNSYEYFINMDLDGIKKDFTDFILNKKNFDDILKELSNFSDFLSVFYNEFEDAQKLNTSNKGSQRQLKPTLKMARLYVLGNTFGGINEDNMQLAMVLRKYFTSQSTFENAIGIQKEKNENKVPDHILKEPLIEKIDETAQKIANSAADTLSEMSNMALNKYTFEMLSKSDPINFVLGKICTCCSHLEGAGYGIMRASIISPEVQNIVIRDERGVIVAKSTLYVNTKEGYGVCNNFEVNDTVEDKDRELIKEKFLKAIREFANQYNKDYPERKKLTKINVGAGNNDLGDLFPDDKMVEGEDELLAAISYSNFGNSWNRYNGDSEGYQIKVWEIDEKEKD